MHEIKKMMKQNEFLAILDASTLPSHVERRKKSNGTVVFTAETSFKVEDEDLRQYERKNKFYKKFNSISKTKSGSVVLGWTALGQG